jgi:hypothetical protein
MDPVHDSLQAPDSSIGDFFARPVQIYSFAWTPGTAPFIRIDPWSLFFENKRVSNRINNYNLLQSDLCVKIAVSGNGFNAGRMLAYYTPLFSTDRTQQPRSGEARDLVLASQRMHLWLNPTTSQGGVMKLPFVYPANALQISKREWDHMGTLNFAAATTLAQANKGPTPLTITVFAWAENIKLSVPTLTNMGALSPQANEAEAMSSGPISGPANVVANVAGALKSVPQISGLATTTQAAAKMVSSTAQALGFSKPNSLAETTIARVGAIGNGTNANTVDTSVKLTYDAKAETTIDSAAVGIKSDPDEMSILKMAQHESYIAQFEWDPAAASETLLWNTHVHPTCSQVIGNYPGRQICMPAVAGVAFPFEFWRGTLKYRFQVVGTAFHRGRLKISWDPLPTGGKSESNVQYTHVLDIGESKDFTIEVGWGSGTAYNRVGKTFFPAGDNIPISNEMAGMSNGILQVHVLNKLTVPYLMDPIKVLVSVSAGDDFEVAAPSRDKLTEFSYFSFSGPPTIVMPSNEEPVPPDVPIQPLEAQAAEPDSTEDNTPEEAAPEKSDEPPLDHFGPPVKASNIFQLVHFGDPVISLRQILKRYEHLASDTWAHKSIYNTNIKVDTIIPRQRGYCGDLESMDSSIEGKPYNFTIQTLFTWFSPMFLAMRGGIRRKFFLDSMATYSFMSVAREADPDADVVRLTLQTTNDTGADDRASALSRTRVAPVSNGGVMQDASVNGTMEVEFPFHSNYRFYTPRRLCQRSTLGTWDNPKYIITVPATNRPNTLHEFVAAGDDFSLHWFQGMPMLWEYPDADPIAVRSTSALADEPSGDPTATV